MSRGFIGLRRRRAALAALCLLVSAALAYAEDSEIESEPIPLDSPDPRYKGYFDQVRQKIKGQWVYPCVKNPTTGQCEYKSARLVVNFGIAKDGRVAKVEVRQSSGYGIYDEYAVNAINSASPFPPLPPELMAQTRPGSGGVRIVATFIYVMEGSTRLLTDRRDDALHSRRAYFDQVRERVKDNLESPCVVQGATCEYKVTEVSVEFSVDKDGRPGSIVVRSPSPWPIYNEYSVRAVRLASPFPRILDEAGFTMLVTFKYTTRYPPELLVE